MNAQPAKVEGWKKCRCTTALRRFTMFPAKTSILNQRFCNIPICWIMTSQETGWKLSLRVSDWLQTAGTHGWILDHEKALKAMTLVNWEFDSWLCHSEMGFFIPEQISFFPIWNNLVKKKMENGKIRSQVDGLVVIWQQVVIYRPQSFSTLVWLLRIVRSATFEVLTFTTFHTYPSPPYIRKSPLDTFWGRNSSLHNLSN